MLFFLNVIVLSIFQTLQDEKTNQSENSLVEVRMEIDYVSTTHLKKMWWFLPVEKSYQNSNYLYLFLPAKIFFEHVGISASVKPAKLC